MVRWTVQACESVSLRKARDRNLCSRDADEVHRCHAQHAAPTLERRRNIGTARATPGVRTPCMP